MLRNLCKVSEILRFCKDYSINRTSSRLICKISIGFNFMTGLVQARYYRNNFNLRVVVYLFLIGSRKAITVSFKLSF